MDMALILENFINGLTSKRINYYGLSFKESIIERYPMSYVPTALWRYINFQYLPYCISDGHILSSILLANRNKRITATLSEIGSLEKVKLANLEKQLLSLDKEFSSTLLECLNIESKLKEVLMGGYEKAIRRKVFGFALNSNWIYSKLKTSSVLDGTYLYYKQKLGISNPFMPHMVKEIISEIEHCINLDKITKHTLSSQTTGYDLSIIEDAIINGIEKFISAHRIFPDANVNLVDILLLEINSPHLLTILEAPYLAQPFKQILNSLLYAPVLENTLGIELKSINFSYNKGATFLEQLKLGNFAKSSSFYAYMLQKDAFGKSTEKELIKSLFNMQSAKVLMESVLKYNLITSQNFAEFIINDTPIKLEKSIFDSELSRFMNFSKPLVTALEEWAKSLQLVSTSKAGSIEDKYHLMLKQEKEFDISGSFINLIPNLKDIDISSLYTAFRNIKRDADWGSNSTVEFYKGNQNAELTDYWYFLLKGNKDLYNIVETIISLDKLEKDCIKMLDVLSMERNYQKSQIDKLNSILFHRETSLQGLDIKELISFISDQKEIGLETALMLEYKLKNIIGNAVSFGIRNGEIDVVLNHNTLNELADKSEKLVEVNPLIEISDKNLKTAFLNYFEIESTRVFLETALMYNVLTMSNDNRELYKFLQKGFFDISGKYADVEHYTKLCKKFKDSLKDNGNVSYDRSSLDMNIVGNFLELSSQLKYIDISKLNELLKTAIEGQKVGTTIKFTPKFGRESYKIKKWVNPISNRRELEDILDYIKLFDKYKDSKGPILKELSRIGVEALLPQKMETSESNKETQLFTGISGLKIKEMNTRMLEEMCSAVKVDKEFVSLFSMISETLPKEVLEVVSSMYEKDSHSAFYEDIKSLSNAEHEMDILLKSLESIYESRQLNIMDKQETSSGQPKELYEIESSTADKIKLTYQHVLNQTDKLKLTHESALELFQKFKESYSNELEILENLKNAYMELGFTLHDMHRRWYFLPSDGPYDDPLVPDQDWSYEDYPINGYSTNPLEGKEKGKGRILVDLNIMKNFIDFMELLFKSLLQGYIGYTPEQALQHFIVTLYEWLENQIPDTIDKIPEFYPTDYQRTDHLTLSQRIDYWRIFRHVRWYAESMINNIPENEKYQTLGAKYIRSLIDKMIDYYKKHHSNADMELDKIKGWRRRDITSKPKIIKKEEY